MPGLSVSLTLIVFGVALCVFAFGVSYSIFYSLGHTNLVGMRGYLFNMLSDSINHSPEHEIGGFLLAIGNFCLGLSLMLRYMYVRHRILTADDGSSRRVTDSAGGRLDWPQESYVLQVNTRALRGGIVAILGALGVIMFPESSQASLSALHSQQPLNPPLKVAVASHQVCLFVCVGSRYRDGPWNLGGLLLFWDVLVPVHPLLARLQRGARWDRLAGHEASKVRALPG